MIKLKNISLVCFLCYSCELKSQTMKEEKFPRILSKIEVQTFINSGEAVYDSSLSKVKFMDVYKFSDGRVIFRSPNGKGAYWKSLDQISEIVSASEKETEVFNFKGWIKCKEDLSIVKEKSLNLLREKTKKEIEYNKKYLAVINRVKVKNITLEKDLFYALIYYSCEICASELEGIVDIEQIDGTDYYRPIVKDKLGRVYIPYLKFLDSIVEKTKVTLAQSLEIELIKYKLQG